jgi:3-mercaptopyruvate sulfurtransferase SseA
VAQEMRINGFNKAFALKGGWKEWQDSQYPIELK